MALAIISPLACGAQSTFGIEADGTAIVSDDPFLLNDGATSAAALQIAVRPRLSQTLGPSTSADLSGQVAYRQYTRRYGDFLTGQVRAEARHRDSEYLSVDTALFYARALPADALTETIDFSVEPQSIRQSYGALTHVDVNTDARTSFNLSVGWDRLRYPGSQLLLPTDALTTSLNARRRISANNWVGILGSYTRSQMVDSAALTAKSLRGTLVFRPRPALDANVQFGVEWADLGAWPGLGTPPGNGRARPSGSANVCYRPTRWEACLDTSLRSEVSAIGGLQREYFIGARGRYQIGEHSAVLANAEYRKVALGGIVPEASALRASVGYDRRLTRNIWWTSTGSYIDRRFISGHRADALVVQFGVSFRKERL
jgi:hypothetical protein